MNKRIGAIGSLIDAFAVLYFAIFIAKTQNQWIVREIGRNAQHIKRTERGHAS